VNAITQRYPPAPGIRTHSGDIPSRSSLDCPTTHADLANRRDHETPAHDAHQLLTKRVTNPASTPVGKTVWAEP